MKCLVRPLYADRSAVRPFVFALVIFLMNAALLNLQAQTINFTTTPATTAQENIPYTGKIQAIISNNDSLFYTAPVLPSWLTLNADGAQNAAKINNTHISGPAGVALDAQGNYYVVQNSGTTIYKILPDGTTTVFAQRMSGANYGALVVGHYLYVSYYTGSSGVQRFDLRQTNPVGETIFNQSGNLSMTYKDGYLYVARYSYSTVIKINLADLTVSTVVQNAPGCFGLGFDPAGNLLIAQHGQRSILKYNPQTQQLTTVLANLPSLLTDVKIDALGYTYISFWPGRIRKYTPDLSNYIEISPTSMVCMGMTMTESGVLIYGDHGAGNVYSLQTGIVLSGTPTHNDVGVHPVKVAVSNGTVSATHAFTITVTDPNPPVICSYSPAVNAVDVALNTGLSATFSETIVKGSGKIYIKNKATDAVLQTIAVTSSAVSIADNILSVTLNTPLPHSSGLYLAIDAGAFLDVNNNPFAGISQAAVWYFQTVEQTQQPQSISIKATGSAVYGQANVDPAAVSTSGLPVIYTSSNPLIADIIDGKVRIKKVGTVSIIATQPGNEAYFPADPAVQQLTISPAPIQVTVQPSPLLRKVYDGNTLIPVAAENYVLNGIVHQDNVTITGTANFDNPNAGTNKTITLTNFKLEGQHKDNYILQTTTATVQGQILPRQLLITATAQAKSYGTADPELTYTMSGLVNQDKLNGKPERATGNSVGTYAIKQGTLSAGPNYTIEFTTAQLTIHPALLSIHAKNQTKVYGTEDPELTYTITGLINNDPLSGQLQRVPGNHAGVYPILQGSLSAGSNYTISFTPSTLNITPAPLSITADSKTKAYGAADPEFTYTVSGLVNNDAISGQLERNSGNVPGEYQISLGTLNAGNNYSITYHDAYLKIVPAELTIVADKKKKIYGHADPELTYTVKGLVGNDQLTGKLVRVTGENAGTYDIVQGSISGGNNYDVQFQSASFEITPAPLTVVATDHEKVYGTPDPDLTFTVSGLVQNDQLTGSLTRMEGSRAGDYTIQQGTLTGGSNYTISFTPATLKITPAAVTVVALNSSKVYGTADPVLTYSATGLVGNDQLEGALSREAGRHVGRYRIQQGSLSGGVNYTLDFTGAELEITPAPLLISAEDKSRDEWKEDPEFTFHYSGLAENDKPTDLTSMPRAKSSAVLNSAPGKYEITVTGAASPNYTISYKKGVLTVMAIDKKHVKAWSNGTTNLQIRIFSETTQNVALHFISLSGQVIKTQKQYLRPGVNTISMPIGHVAPSLYILQVNADKFKEAVRVKF